VIRAAYWRTPSAWLIHLQFTIEKKFLSENPAHHVLSNHPL
jgi:hypothetical protein